MTDEPNDADKGIASSDTLSDTAATNPWDEIGTDPKLESDGAWVDDFLAPGWRVKVRSISSDRARNRQQRQFVALRAIITANNGAIPPAMQTKNLIEMCATALVADWEGIPDPDQPGVLMACNEMNIRRLAAHPKVGRQFRDAVSLAANQDSLFRAEAVAAMEKN